MASTGTACRVRVYRESPSVWRVKASCAEQERGFEGTEHSWIGALADAHFHLRHHHHQCDPTWMATWTEERGFYCKVCGEPMSLAEVSL